MEGITRDKAQGEIREKHKDNLLFTEITCPLCGETYRKLPGLQICDKCRVRIFDRDSDGYIYIADPAKMDRNKTYKVYNFRFSDDEPIEVRAGEVVEIDEKYRMTDTMEIRRITGDDFYRSFVMPEHDVVIEREYSTLSVDRPAGNFAPPPMALMGMGTMGTGMMGMAMMNMVNMNMMNAGSPVSTSDGNSEPAEIECPGCKMRVPLKKFCCNCGIPLPQELP